MIESGYYILILTFKINILKFYTHITTWNETLRGFKKGVALQSITSFAYKNFKCSAPNGYVERSCPVLILPVIDKFKTRPLCPQILENSYCSKNLVCMI